MNGAAWLKKQHLHGLRAAYEQYNAPHAMIVQQEVAWLQYAGPRTRNEEVFVLDAKCSAAPLEKASTG